MGLAVQATHFANKQRLSRQTELPLDEFPFAPGSAIRHGQFHMQWQLQADGIAIVLVQLDQHAFHQKVNALRTIPSPSVSVSKLSWSRKWDPSLSL
jgi:hypothetical protein